MSKEKNAFRSNVVVAPAGSHKHLPSLLPVPPKEYFFETLLKYGRKSRNHSKNPKTNIYATMHWGADHIVA